MKEYLAHIDEEHVRKQLLKSHLRNVEKLAGAFTESFRAENLGRLAGCYHDIGKYSEKFQYYLRGECASGGDHSTAGAQFLYALIKNKKLSPAFLLSAIAIAGHHGGLPDFGSRGVDSGPTFLARMKKRVEPCGAWQKEISLPSNKQKLPEIIKDIAQEKNDLFGMQFLLRMLFSCLVDADYLDTEAFMNNSVNAARKGFCTIFALRQQLDVWLNKSFLNPAADGYNREINVHRRQILQACLQAGDTLENQMARLTVPTGGGKTIASLAFALHYAERKHLQHVIYVIPYTSIIEQNAKVFANILGKENIVEHHANVEYDETDGKEYRKKLATENWDAPIIVTTNVQFFESLFANRTSKCRKLHNIAQSVIIFDEVQMLPLSFLQPCLQAIKELAARYGCAMLFCTATQPALEKFLQGWQLRELFPKLDVQFAFFQRVAFQCLEDKISQEELAEKLLQEKQVLCIVNTKKEAREIYQYLADNSGEFDVNFHLSTNLCAVHRENVLQRIRQRLQKHQPCRVVATSLIEAGVDIDFPKVYREMAGLDSIVQAAGRCNREGHQRKEDSIVTVFQLEHSHIVPEMKRAAIVASKVVAEYGDNMTAPLAIQKYFEQLYALEGEDSFDKKHIMTLIKGNKREKGKQLPMAEIAKRFIMIEDHTRQVFIPYDEKGRELLEHIKASHGVLSRTLLRAAGRYEVSVYAGNEQQPFEKLLAVQKIAFLDESDNFAFLQDESIYDKNTLGLNVNVEDGEEIVF